MLDEEHSLELLISSSSTMSVVPDGATGTLHLNRSRLVMPVRHAPEDVAAREGDELIAARVPPGEV